MSDDKEIKEEKIEETKVVEDVTEAAESVEEEKTQEEPKAIIEAEVVKEEVVESEIVEEGKDKSGFATASLVLGIIAAVIVCTSKLSSICAILAIIFACIGKNNKGAKAGLILGIVVLSLDFLLIILSLFLTISSIPLMILGEL